MDTTKNGMVEYDLIALGLTNKDLCGFNLHECLCIEV